MKKLVIVMLLIGLVFSVAGCGTGSTVEASVINAVGTGKITTAPDELEVGFSVITQGKDKNVQQENAKKVQKVIDALLNIGLTKEEMETKSVNFRPLTRWDEKAGEQIIGYQAENTINIKTHQVDLAGKISDTAVENGASMVGNMAFNLSDEGKEKLLEQAIEKAVLDAKKQAEAAAKASGVSIAGIKEINVQKSAGSMPIFYSDLRMKAMEQAAVDTPVLPQDTDYVVSVNVSFIIK